MRIDHLSRLPVMPPSTFDVNWYKSSHNGFLDISRSNGGLRISDYYYYYKYHWLECYHHIVAGALYKNLDLKCWTVQYRRDCWIGQLSCLLIFSTSWSLAAFLHRAGGSMLESTGSHGRGVDRRVPEMHYWLSEIQQFILCRLKAMKFLVSDSWMIDTILILGN